MPNNYFTHLVPPGVADADAAKVLDQQFASLALAEFRIEPRFGDPTQAVAVGGPGCFPMDSPQVRKCIGLKQCTCEAPCVHCLVRSTHLLECDFDRWLHHRTHVSITIARQATEKVVAKALGVSRECEEPTMFPLSPTDSVRMCYPETMHCHLIGNSTRRCACFCAMLNPSELLSLNGLFNNVVPGHWDKLPPLTLLENLENFKTCNVQQLQRYMQVLHWVVAPWLTLTRIKTTWVKWLTIDERLAEEEVVPLVVRMLVTQAQVNHLVFTHCHLGDSDGTRTRRLLLRAVEASMGVVNKLFGHFKLSQSPKGAVNFGVLNEHQQVCDGLIIAC